MMKSTVAVASAALLAVFATGAFAHHTTAQYDSQHPVEQKGVIKEFSPANPHMELTLAWTDAKGAHTIDLEGQSVNNLYRMGYRRGMINIGDTVTVTYSPLKPGMNYSTAGLFRTIVLADGRSFGGRQASIGPNGVAPAAAAPGR